MYNRGLDHDKPIQIVAVVLLTGASIAATVGILSSMKWTYIPTEDEEIDAAQQSRRERVDQQQSKTLKRAFFDPLNITGLLKKVFGS